MSDIVPFLGLCAVGVFLLFAAIGTPIYAIGYHVDKGRCGAWGETTNRDTKFVALSKAGPFPVSWDCFTPDEGGKWIPTSRVRDID